MLCANSRVDLVLMDVCTARGSSGLDAAAQLKARYPQIKIIIVTSAPEYRFFEKARAAKVDSFWYKDSSEDELLSIMDRTVAGESVYPNKTPDVSIGLASSCEFTPKELEVLYWLVEVAATRNIAERMGISEDGVNEHIKHLKIEPAANPKQSLPFLYRAQSSCSQNSDALFIASIHYAVVFLTQPDR